MNKSKSKTEEKVKFVVTTRAIIEHPVNKNTFLVIKRTAGDKKNASKWEFPGGKVDKNEKIENACKRETFEEISLKIFVGQQKPELFSEIIKTGMYANHTHISIGYKCDIEKTKTLEIKLSHEHTEYKWVNLSEIIDSKKSRSFTYPTRFFADCIEKTQA